MDYQDHIISNPEILYGKPTIKGTRIGVDLIIEKLAAGESIEQLMMAYPHITKEQIYACLSYATAVIRNEDIHYLKAS
jgi:uncharacterized protein (DUF433 family)